MRVAGKSWTHIALIAACDASCRSSASFVLCAARRVWIGKGGLSSLAPARLSRIPPRHSTIIKLLLESDLLPHTPVVIRNAQTTGHSDGSLDTRVTPRLSISSAPQ